MAAKILPKRKLRHPLSDSSDSSPEQEERRTKWTLLRAPLQFTKESSIKITTTPTSTPANVQPTSTPCLRVAPPFQLSQTMLSPISKEQAGNSFKVQKSGKPEAAEECTFDNLLASQFQPDISSKLVVNRRENPLQRRNNEADVERTRQYAGGRTAFKNFSAEGCETSELTISSTVKELKKVTPLTKENQECGVFETIAKSKRESVEGKVLTGVVEDSDKVQRPTTSVGLKGRNKRNVLKRLSSERAVENAQRRASLRNAAPTEVLQLVDINEPSEGPEVVFNCDITTSLESAHCREENYDRNVDQSKGSNVTLQVKRHCPQRTDVNKRRSDVSLRQGLGGFPERTVAQNKTSDVSLRVEQISLRRRSNLLPEFRVNQGKENSGNQDILEGRNDKAAADSHLSEKKGTPGRIRESVDEKTSKEELEAKERNELEMSPVLSMTSKPGKRKEQTVSGEGDMLAQTKRKQAVEGKSRNDQPVSIKQTHKSAGESRKATDELTSVLKTQISLLESDDLLKSVELLESLGLVSSKQISISKGDVTDVTRSENKSIRDSEEYFAEFCLPACENKGGSADGPEVEEGSCAGLAAGRSRKESCSVNATKHSEGGKAESTADRSRKHGMSATCPERTGNNGKIEPRAGRSRKGISRVDNVDNLEHSGSDGKAESIIDQSINKSNSGGDSAYCKNRINYLTTGQSIKQSSSDVDTKHMRDITAGSTAGQGRKAKRRAYSFEHEDRDAQRPAVCNGKGQETSDDGDEHRPISTGNEKTEGLPTSISHMSKLPQDRLSGPGNTLRQVSRLSGRSPEKIVNERKAPKESCKKKRHFTKDSFKRKADKRNILLKKKTDKNLKPKDAHEFSDALTVSDRPRRERRPPGDYWVAAPNLTTGRKETRGDRRRSRNTIKAVETPDEIRSQPKKRRLLPTKELRKSDFPAPLQSKESVLSHDSKSTDRNSKGRSFSALICHAENVQLINKNSGLPSENPNVRIGPTVSWSSISGRLFELDPGAVSGPQVVLGNQVFIVMEGTIVLKTPGEQTENILNPGDLAVVPSDENMCSEDQNKLLG